jgi:hypothetical protein
LDTSLITILTNLGTGGVVIVLIILGLLIPKPTVTRLQEDCAHKDEEIARLQEALALERQRSNDATQAATVTNQLIGALTTLATEHRALEKHEHQDAADKADARALPGGVLDLTAKDLGL